MSGIAGKPWSPEEATALREMILQGKTQTEVSTCFPGRSIAGAERQYRKMKRAMGIAPPPLSRTDARTLYCKQTEGQVELSDAAYLKWSRQQAERGCRMLKEAMDRYYANRAQQKAA